jgi:hypothetical protein
VYAPVTGAIAAREYEDRKSSGQAKYLLLAVVMPVTFLRSAGICTVLYMRFSACVMNKFMSTVGKVFSVYDEMAETNAA